MRPNKHLKWQNDQVLAKKVKKKRASLYNDHLWSYYASYDNV